MLLKGKKRSNKGLLLLVQAWWVGKFEQRVGKIIFNGDSKKEKKKFIILFFFWLLFELSFWVQGRDFPRGKIQPINPIHPLHPLTRDGAKRVRGENGPNGTSFGFAAAGQTLFDFCTTF